MGAMTRTDRADVGRVDVPPGLRAQFRAQGWWGDHCVLDWWRLAVAAAPDAQAVVDRSGTRLTYAEADLGSSRLAHWLVAAGVRPGHVVGVQLPNWSEFLVAFVATMKVGAAINPLATNLRRTELTHAFEACCTRVAIMPASYRRTDFRPLGADLVAADTGLTAVLFARCEDAASSCPDPGSDLAATIAGSPPLPEADWVRADADAVAAILFTSGSEAEPKGVMLTHNNVIASELSFAEALNLSHEDRILMPAPLGHATGFLHGVIQPILTRGSSVLCDSSEGPVMAELASRHRPTCGMSVPSVIDALLTACEERGSGLASMRFLCCGGSPVPRRLQERARDLGVRLHSVYGATESAPHTMTRIQDSAERVVTTDGRACPGTEIRVVDPITRRTLPPGVQGEEASRGPAVFAGYLGRPDLTAKVLDAEGWYYSGDLAIMDADGYLRITGRRRDIINRGGENISPAEVEAVLLGHPAVSAAAVVAMPDAVLGQRACAFLVARPGAERLDVAGLCTFFGSLGVAKFKIPERVEYLDELPQTASGKVAKGVLRKAIAASLRSPGGQDCVAAGTGSA